MASQGSPFGSKRRAPLRSVPPPRAEAPRICAPPGAPGTAPTNRVTCANPAESQDAILVNYGYLRSLALKIEISKHNADEPAMDLAAYSARREISMSVKDSLTTTPVCRAQRSVLTASRTCTETNVCSLNCGQRQPHQSTTPCRVLARRR